MAEKRKLLAEMDKCFKKIDEGVEIFEEIMAKMQEANSDNQREKFQDDLKKEIKKLQRLRDQIKGWQNSSDIKDKDSLAKYRKVIEQRMEQFKDIERENKTKPHSKQGLIAEDKMDPREKEKLEAIEWLNCQIRSIQDEIDRTETKIETLLVPETGRKRAKGKEDTKKGEKEAEDLRKHLERVNFHLSNLEICMRLITNEQLDIKTVLNKLKEPIEMYVEALDPENDENPDELDPDDIYDELNLNSYIPQLGGVVVGSIDEERMFAENGEFGMKSLSGSPPPSSKDSDDLKQRHLSDDVPKSQPKTIVATPLKLSSQMSIESTSLSSPPPATPPPPPNMPYNSVAAGKHHIVSTTLPGKIPVPTSSPVNKTLTEKPVSENSSPVSTAVPTTVSSSTQLSASSTIDETSSPSYTQNDNGAQLSSSLSPASTPDTSNVKKRFSFTNGNSTQETTILKSVAPQSISSADIDTSSEQTPITIALPQENLSTELSNLNSMTPPQSIGNNGLTSLSNMEDLNQSTLQHVLRLGQNSEPKSREPQTAHIPPWLGASPLGRAQITPEMEGQLAMLDNAINHLPAQMDNEKPRSYLPKMVCQTSPYYPQVPLSNADTLEYYLRLSPETLFFVFYYMEGSRAQLLAAKALKKLSWRFHTKYLMWFQRHEEPKQITDDYEQGTYVYFDFEKWSQRKKEAFTFEYKFLEDKDFD